MAITLHYGQCPAGNQPIAGRAPLAYNSKTLIYSQYIPPNVTSPFSHNTLSPLTRLSPSSVFSGILLSRCPLLTSRRLHVGFFKVLRIQHLACAALISLRRLRCKDFAHSPTDNPSMQNGFQLTFTTRKFRHRMSFPVGFGRK